jgi:hypothetical protein
MKRKVLSWVLAVAAVVARTTGISVLAEDSTPAHLNG